MTRLLMIALVASALGGCQDIVGVEVSPPFEEPDEGFLARGSVIPGALPADPNGQIAVMWPLFGGGDGPDTVVFFGGGMANVDDFEVAVLERPPPDAFARDSTGAPTVAVGFVFAFPASFPLPPEGLLPDLDLLDNAYAATPRHAILFEESADDPRTPWDVDFEPGFHCARCIDGTGTEELEGWESAPCDSFDLVTGTTDDLSFCFYDESGQ